MPVKRFIPAALLLATACSGDPLRPASFDAPEPAAARNAAENSRAIWTWYGTLSDNVTPTLLRGDGLAVDGVTPADPPAYEGGRCAVRATISWYGAPNRATGDAFFAPAGGTSDPLCPAGRTITVVIGGVTHQLQWTTTVSEVMQVAVNETRTQDLMFGPTPTLPCARIIYSLEVGSQVRVTRTAGDTQGTAGEWTIESDGNHEAGCYVFAKGNKLSWNGSIYYLPFRASFAEVR